VGPVRGHTPRCAFGLGLTMANRCGASRSLGPTKVCAIHIRGGMRCAWCGVTYHGRGDASIDHLDGDPQNNDSTNLVSAHIGCNASRAHEWPAGKEWTPRAADIEHAFGSFWQYLLRKGTPLEAGIRRAALQRIKTLDLDAGRHLARQWYPGYCEKCNRANRAWRYRKTPEGRAEIERAQAYLRGSGTLAG